MENELSNYKNALNEFAIIAIMDKNGIIVFVNDNFCKISKYSNEELLGQDYRIMNSANYHSEKVIQNIWITISRGEIWKGELKNKAQDGTVYWLDTTIVPFLDEYGKPYQYIAIRYDISLLKAAEEKSINYSRALEFKNQQLVDFCNVVSHNLRAPLINISMLVDFIRESQGEEERNEVLGKIKPVVNHLLDVFNELVESLQIRQNTEIRNEEIDIKDCLKRNLIGFETQIKEYKVTIEFDLDKAPKIFFPQKYIDDILNNLLSNALKYRSPERSLYIKIKTEKVKNGILMSISDNGLGIDLDMHKNHIFKIRKTFHKHNNARGFGLFLIKTQIETMDGKIWVKSKVNEGTTFYVEFKSPNI